MLLLFNLFLLPTFFRNAGNAVLHPLLAVADDRAQNGHVQIFRSGHFRRHWAQRHHYGHGVLHDAAGKFGRESLFNGREMFDSEIQIMPLF